MTPTKTRLTEAGITLLIAALGALAFWLVGFPAAILTGPAVAVSAVSLSGLPVSIPPLLRDAVFLVLGVQIGSTVTPEVIATALAWPLSLAVLTLVLIIVLIICKRVLMGSFGYDRMTALLSATPGHLSYVLGMSAEAKADVARVALVQTVRVLLLTVLVPVLIAVWGVEGTAHQTDPAPISWLSLGLLFPLAVLLGAVFKRLGIPAPLLLGAMAVSAIGHGADLTPGLIPTWMSLAAFVCMGALIGTRFSGIDRTGLAQAFVAGITCTVVACVVAGAGAWVASALVGLPPAALLLAFAPGGVEVMAAIAVETGLEPAFVAAHHVFRLLVLSVLIPVFVTQARRAPNP